MTSTGPSITFLSPVLMTARHRNLTVLLLSVISMVACFSWWGRVPFQMLTLHSQSLSTTTNVEHQWFLKRNYNNNRPPPYLFQSSHYAPQDDDTLLQSTGESQGERVRGIPGVQRRNETNTDNSSYQEEAFSVSNNSNNEPWPYYSFEDLSRPRPKVVWLMSYPNSGTSYTMSMVARGSSRAIATNYGKEVTSPPTLNTPLYPNQWEGPYYHPSPQRPLPTDYILVKTHCGGRCIPCAPEEYIINETFFFDECRRGSGILPEQVRGRMTEDNDDTPLPDGLTVVHYNASIVKKAIHLIRSPFDNMVSRFHLERKHWVENNKMMEVNRYANNATGFQKWCEDMNRNYGPTNKGDNHNLIPDDIVELMEPVPCHGEFYKYVQWHNMANAVMTKRLRRPIMVVHYENYEKKWNETATKIFDYLHLNFEGVQRVFHPGHDYDPYFTTAQRQSAKYLVERLATPAVWIHVQRYFAKL